MSTPVREQYIIDREGNKTAIILSIEQYEQMLEDLHDLAIVAERRSSIVVSGMFWTPCELGIKHISILASGDRQ